MTCRVCRFLFTAALTVFIHMYHEYHTQCRPTVMSNSSDEVDAHCGSSPYPPKHPSKQPDVTFVDLFCGFGGFACGATMFTNIFFSNKKIGHAGVDSCSEALRQWGGNVKSTGHDFTCVCQTIDQTDTFDYGFEENTVVPGAVLYVHSSFPCALFSNARRGKGEEEAEKNSVLLTMRHFFESVVRNDYKYWSFEQVAAVTILDLLSEFKQNYPDKIDFAVLDASSFGCPSDRRRLIAAPPAAIKILKEFPVERVSIADALERRRLQVPSTHIRNSNHGAKTRSVLETAFTVVASHPLTWSNNVGETVRCLNTDESATLMSFPTEWKPPRGQRNAITAIGNAIPPIMAYHIIKSVFEANGHELSSSTTWEPTTYNACTTFTHVPPTTGTISTAATSTQLGFVESTPGTVCVYSGQDTGPSTPPPPPPAPVSSPEQPYTLPASSTELPTLSTLKQEFEQFKRKLVQELDSLEERLKRSRTE